MICQHSLHEDSQATTPLPTEHPALDDTLIQNQVRYHAPLRESRGTEAGCPAHTVAAGTATFLKPLLSTSQRQKGRGRGPSNGQL